MKKQLLRLYSLLCSIPLQLRTGVLIGNKCMVLGFIKIRMKRGSRLILGESVTLLSHNRFNPLIQQKMRINIFSPQACLELGDGVGISGSHIACCAHIRIGAHTIIGPNCIIFDWKAHDYSPERGWAGRSRIQGSPIHIGKRCYIGLGCTILRGVSIGDDCIIAAGTIVNQDIPPAHLAFGNPIQYKKRRLTTPPHHATTEYHD